MRNSKRIIYTSSYDRGLEHLLGMWPDVRREVPDAELHIFYGWQLFDQFYKDNPGAMAWKAKMVEMMKQDGVTDHGRLAQPELKLEYEKSGVWAYPAHFGEISCISAIKAQSAGCEPVIVNYAALRETVKYGRRIEGDIYDEETKVAFKKELIDALKNPMSDKDRMEMKKAIMSMYGWSQVASQWSTEFKGGEA